MTLNSNRRVIFVDNQVHDFLHYRLELALRLQEEGYEVHVALPNEPGLLDIQRKGIRVHVVRLLRFGTQPVDELRCCVSLSCLYRRLRPALVHHFCLKPALYGGIAARFARVPAAVSTLTGLGYLFSAGSTKLRAMRKIVVWGLRFSFGHPNHHVVFQNREDRAYLLPLTGLPLGRSSLIRGSGVNTGLFREHPEPQGVPVVLMASRLLWAKGVGDFVTVARELRAKGVGARFLLLGESDAGHPSAIPQATLEQWRDSGAVEWPGWNSNMPTAIARSHVVCLPSLYGEGVPRVLLEAAASGRPIVASDTPGCRDVVRHRYNGLLVPPNDGEALAQALSLLIQEPSLRASMGRCGRTLAVTEFSLEQAIEANLGVYRALVNLGSNGAAEASS